MVNIARVIDGIVVNIEVASQEWLDAQDDPGIVFVPYTDADPAPTGGTWDGKTFTAPDADPIVPAYERGKADGASELLSMQANVAQEL
jgi:hypothetical protein